MTRAQRQSNMCRTHTHPDAMPESFDTPTFLSDLRLHFATLIPQIAASDVLAAQIGDTGMVNTVCSHDTMTEARSMGSDDHETLYGCCTGCGIPMIGTRFYSHPDEVVCRAMTDGEIVRERTAA